MDEVHEELLNAHFSGKGDDELVMGLAYSYEWNIMEALREAVEEAKKFKSRQERRRSSVLGAASGMGKWTTRSALVSIETNKDVHSGPNVSTDTDRCAVHIMTTSPRIWIVRSMRQQW